MKELVQSVVATGSHLLDRKNHRGWADLSDDEVAQAATALMIGLEDNAFLLAEEISSEKIAINPTENIREYMITSMPDFFRLRLMHIFLAFCVSPSRQ